MKNKLILIPILDRKAVKTIYIAGKMSGLPGYGYRNFMKAEKRLVSAGYKVVNPARLNTAGDNWEKCLRNDLFHIVKKCSGMAVLRNWRHSKGARLEVATAIQLGMLIIDAISLRPLKITLEQKFTQRRI